MVLNTLLCTSSNFVYNTTLNTRSNVQTILNSINFDAIEPTHMIRLKPIVYQGADINIYTQYILSILNKKDNTLNSILMETWTQLGSNVLKLPLIVHEKCIEVNPVIFEKTVFSAILLWQIEDLIDFCSKSPLVFQTCSSIFNKLLIKLNFTDKFMKFLINFIKDVNTLCENNNIDIINIYPIKCRSILTLRAINNTNTSLSSTLSLKEEVETFSSNYPREFMCLLSHYPDLYIPN